MRLKLELVNSSAHSGLATAVLWSEFEASQVSAARSSVRQLYSCGDDSRVWKWNLNESKGQPTDTSESQREEICVLSSHITCASWCPKQSFAAVGCSNGSYNLVSNKGRIEHTVSKAHRGAITCISWNNDGSALITGGEDGVVKQWSRNGNLRSKLAQSSGGIYGAVWSPNESSVLFCSGKNMSIKPLVPTEKAMVWKGHDGVVLCVDWNPITNLIISGGEDCRYKIWDCYGRNLYSSKTYDFPITCVVWQHSGNFAAVGSFNAVMVADQIGWLYSHATLSDASSVLDIKWSVDGSHLSACTASGGLFLGKLTERKVRWHQYEACVVDDRQLIVRDVMTDSSVFETLDFTESIVDVSVGFDHVIVATTQQIYICNISSLHTPQLMNVGGSVSLILPSYGYFVMVDSTSGLGTYGYEGRLMASIKIPSLRTKFLKSGNICASHDTVVVIDSLDSRKLYFVDPSSGRLLRDAFEHGTEIEFVCVNESVGMLSSVRKLVFIDSNRDLFVIRVHEHDQEPFKLANMVDSVRWHPEADMLVALSEGSLIAWYLPSVVWCDVDLLQPLRVHVSSVKYGRLSSIADISGTLITVREPDGTMKCNHMSALPLRMYKLIEEDGSWHKCLRLCYAVERSELWALLCGLALEFGSLTVAIQAFVALEQIDKVLFLKRMQDKYPTKVQQDVELMLYKNNGSDLESCVNSAEQILLQNEMFYRAVTLNVRLFRWDRALRLAVKYEKRSEGCVLTVLAHRQKYLTDFEKEEMDELFTQYFEQVEIDWNVVHEKERREFERECQLAGRDVRDVTKKLEGAFAKNSDGDVMEVDPQEVMRDIESDGFSRGRSQLVDGEQSAEPSMGEESVGFSDD